MGTPDQLFNRSLEGRATDNDQSGWRRVEMPTEIAQRTAVEPMLHNASTRTQNLTLSPPVSRLINADRWIQGRGEAGSQAPASRFGISGRGPLVVSLSEANLA